MDSDPTSGAPLVEIHEKAANVGWVKIEAPPSAPQGHALAGGQHTEATTATLRTQLIEVAARITRSARRTTLRLPTRWPWAGALTRLFAAATGPPSTV